MYERMIAGAKFNSQAARPRHIIRVILQAPCPTTLRLCHMLLVLLYLRLIYYI